MLLSEAVFVHDHGYVGGKPKLSAADTPRTISHMKKVREWGEDGF